MADKTLEYKIAARDETRAAMVSAGDNAGRLHREYEKLDQQVQKLRRTRAQARVKADDQLDRQRIQMLEREARAGNEAAGVEMRRIQITQRFKRERRDLLRLARSEQLSDEQRARAKRQLVQLERQHTRELAGVNQVQRQTAGSATQAAAAVRGMVGAFAGMAGAGLLMRGSVQQLQQIRDEALAFDVEMRQLSSLGDNVNNLPALRRQVLDYSAAWGITRREVADAMFALTSATGNLDEATRDQLLQSTLELTNAYGGDLADNIQLTVKNFQIARDQGESLDDVLGVLALTAERGNLKMQDLAMRMPDAASKADAMGGSFREAAAAIEVATQRGGRTEQTFTGVGNVFLRMAEAEKKGIELTGSLTDKLRQLQDVDGLTRLEIFGAENIAVANNLIKAVDEVEAALGRFDESLPDIAGKVQARLADPAAWFAEMMRAFEQARENALAGNDISPSLQRAHMRQGAAEAEIRKTWMGVVLNDGVQDFIATVDTHLGSGRLADDGSARQIMQFTEAGRFDEAQKAIDTARSAQITQDQADRLRRLEHEVGLARVMQAGRESGWLSDQPPRADDAPRPTDADRRLDGLIGDERARQIADEASEIARGADPTRAEQISLLRRQVDQLEKLVNAGGLSDDRRGEAETTLQQRQDLLAQLQREQRTAGRAVFEDVRRATARAALQEQSRGDGPGALDARIALEQARLADNVNARREALQPLLSGEVGTEDQQREARRFVDALVAELTGRQIEVEQTLRKDDATSRAEREDAAEAGLQRHRIDTLRRLGAMGDEQAALEARRLELDEQFNEQRRHLVAIAEDEKLAAETRARALAEMSELDQLHARARDEMNRDRPQTHTGPLMESEALRRLVFDAGERTPQRDPAAETARHTSTMVDRLRDIVGKFDDLVEVIRESGAEAAVQVYGGKG